MDILKAPSHKIIALVKGRLNSRLIRLLVKHYACVSVKIDDCVFLFYLCIANNKVNENIDFDDATFVLALSVCSGLDCTFFV